MARLFPSCIDSARRLSEQQDGRLSGTVRLGLWLHLAICAHCRRYARQLRLLHSVVGEYPERLARIKLPDHTRAEIIRKLSATS